MTNEAVSDQAPRTILTVDDSSVSRHQLKSALERHGFVVVEAGEGMDALRKAEQQVFDLVITDIHMPNMSGLELIRELRKLPGYRHVPVFVLTSDCSKECLAEGRRVGATAWLVKPPDLATLARAVHQAIHAGREQAAAAAAGAATAPVVRG
jgi:two-component system, chemotaxis family, chemotaxis protein CheY